jgi:site-specific DNA-adenine methylase
MKKVSALIPYFGSGRTIAENVGNVLHGCTHVVIACAGSMCELKYITAPSIIVNDLHRHVINLANVVKDREQRKLLIEDLDWTAVHPDQLKQSQRWCKLQEENPNTLSAFDWAYWYFCASWLCRNGDAGTKKEFDSSFSIRWKDGGGDSATRFRNATKALEDFGEIFRRCTFSTEDCFVLFDRCHDLPKHGLYIDAPWPKDGDNYKFAFTEAHQRKLAARLSQFEHSRVVVRYGDCELIRELYPESEWKWNLLQGKTQVNKSKAEVLLVRN